MEFHKKKCTLEVISNVYFVFNINNLVFRNKPAKEENFEVLHKISWSLI